MKKVLEVLDIPIGWRQLEAHEIKQFGDKFWVNGCWHNSSLLNVAAGTETAFIRALSSNSPDPNAHIALGSNQTPYVPRESTSDKVRAYLQKCNGKT